MEEYDRNADSAHSIHDTVTSARAQTRQQSSVIQEQESRSMEYTIMNKHREQEEGRAIPWLP